MSVRRLRWAQTGQVFDGDVAVEVGLDPLHGLGQVLIGVGWHGPTQVLGLAAVSMGRDHHSSGDLVGCGGTEVLADELQAQVDGGRGPGRR